MEFVSPIYIARIKISINIDLSSINPNLFTNHNTAVFSGSSMSEFKLNTNFFVFVYFKR